MTVDAAIEAAKQDLYVFPVYFEGKRKLPAKKWRDEATTDIPQIYAWWSGRSYPAYGIECERSGIVVVDEDKLDEFQRLAEQLGQTLPETYVVRTGRTGGGRQFHFDNPLGIRNKDLRKRGFDIDIKGAGGYVVGVGSGHPSGSTYRVEHDRPRVPFPTWLAEWLTGAGEEFITPGQSFELPDVIPAGSRDAVLYRYACSMQARRYTKADALWLMEHRAFPLVEQPNGDRYPLSEALSKVEKAYATYGDGYPQPDGKASEDGADSWSPVDLAPYLDGKIERLPPSVGLARSDGLRLLYPGKEHTVIGEMESAKSWLACGSAAVELTNGNPVLYIHFEEADPGDTIERLQALGVPSQVILKLFTFVGPDERVTADRLARLLEKRPTLVVLDGVNEAMSLHAWKVREEDGAATFRRVLVNPCTAAGAATLALDHVVKDKERRGRDALGSIHKGNGLTGVQIILENVEPFGRGLRGRSHVFVGKDRAGHLRRNGRPGGIPGKTFMGELVIDDTRTLFFDLNLTFWAPTEQADSTQPVDQADADDAVVLQAVEKLAAAGKQASLRTLRATLKGMGKDRVDNALTRLTLDSRLIETAGPNRARLFGVAGDQL